MRAYEGTAYQLYNSFRRDLDDATTPQSALDAIVRSLPAFNAGTVAILSEADLADCSGAISGGPSKSMAISLQSCRSALWLDYLALSRSNREPLSRILRLSPYPVALSDLRQNPRLLERSHQLCRLLAQHDMNDVFAIPALDRQMRFSMMLIAGRSLVLRPAHRHVLVLIATDSVACLRRLPAAPAASFPPPPHQKLTLRQMEIAGWLVAGKTDWEIGEILRISPKTVNFHVENIKRAYGVKSRNQFVAAIVHDGGLVPAPPRFAQAELSSP